jgi:hypothetical protein
VVLGINNASLMVLSGTTFTINTVDVTVADGDVTVTAGDLEVTAGSVGVNNAPSSTNMLRVTSTINTIRAAHFTKDVIASSVEVVLIHQNHVDGAIPGLNIIQDDVSEGFINFQGSDRGVVATSTGDSAASVRVELSGTKYIIPLFTDA